VSEPSTAKIFQHGRSQAVRLPKEFRLRGTEVRVSKIGDKVILEPIERASFDITTWRNSLDAYLDVDFPDIPVSPGPSTDDFSFD
jgi:antitoxin VapB